MSPRKRAIFIPRHFHVVTFFIKNFSSFFSWSPSGYCNPTSRYLMTFNLELSSTAINFLYKKTLSVVYIKHLNLDQFIIQPDFSTFFIHIRVLPIFSYLSKIRTPVSWKSTPSSLNFALKVKSHVKVWFPAGSAFLNSLISFTMKLRLPYSIHSLSVFK